jgi:ubiquinone/menaquinone biosynthesis C-methylase UbiE
VSREPKGVSVSDLTWWYLKFWNAILKNKDGSLPDGIVRNLLKGEFVSLKKASALSKRVTKPIPESFLAKLSMVFLDCPPMRMICPYIVNLGFFYDRMIEYSDALSTPLSGGESVLDVGSGYSAFPSYLASKARVISIDINRKTMLFQKKTSQIMGKSFKQDIECVLADSTRLPFIADSFNRSFLVSTIEHIDKDSLITEENSRILKNHGCIFLSFPFSRNPRKPMTEPYFQRFYTKEMISERLVVPSRLKVKKFSTVLKSLSSKVNVLPGWFIMKDIFLFSTVHKIELNAYKKKDGVLVLLKLEKECGD